MYFVAVVANICISQKYRTAVQAVFKHLESEWNVVCERLNKCRCVNFILLSRVLKWQYSAIWDLNDYLLL